MNNREDTLKFHSHTTFYQSANLLRLL